LEAVSENRRAEDFIILPFSIPNDLFHPDQEHGYDVELVAFNIGTTPICNKQVHAEIDQIKQGLPNIPLALLSEQAEPDSVREALSLGIQGYIPTTLPPFMMMHALRLIRAGGTFIPADLLFRAVEGRATSEENDWPDKSPQGFTPRQLEVLQRLRQGMSNKVIAYELQMQESTVKVHVRQILRKLKATNRTQAAFLLSRRSQTQGSRPGA
jgi:DNA-binding NarL/FixJ family response regulator